MISDKISVNMYSPLPDYTEHQIEYQESINNVLLHGKFINGPEVTELENKLATYVGVSNCISVASGTDALLVALMALGIGHGDEVITVAHTWISTAEVIAVIGAKPVFIDVNRDTFLMDLQQVKEKVNHKTKALIYVSLYGQSDYPEKISQLCQELDIYLIEDGAQSFGCESNGIKSCSWGDIGCTSFFPSKPMGAYGDAGACFTNNPELANKIRAIKNHGGLVRFQHNYIGLNARMDTIQAAILLIKFKYFDQAISKRRKFAEYYSDKLKNIDGLVVPTIINPGGTKHSWAQYTILITSEKISRDQVLEKLKENGVNASIFYPIGLQHQPCFQQFDPPELINTDWVCQHVISLPLYPELSIQEINHVIKCLKKLF